jgi:hypothetical protein
MKKFTLFLIFMLAIPCAITQTSNEYYKKDLKQQIAQLKIMLAQSNDAYMNSIPMYKQPLDNHWLIALFTPFKIFQSTSCYNAEVILNESKKLAELIVALEKIQEADQHHA